jgi:hypothetical protein
MRTKCSVQSVITFDNLGLTLQVDRGNGWGMLVHLASGGCLGIYIRDNGKVHWEPNLSNTAPVNPPTEVWSIVSTMI